MPSCLPEEKFDEARKLVMEILSEDAAVKKEAAMICVSALNELFRTSGLVYHLQSFGVVSPGDVYKIY